MMTQTIKEIKDILSALTDLDDMKFTEWATDSRAGVQSAIKQRQKQILAEQAEEARLEIMLAFEKDLYRKSITHIAGIDEVGRGPLAGPVVAAAVILPQNCKIKGLNDSKKIPKSKHQAIYEEIKDKALAYGVGIVEPAVIDDINIYQATKIAMEQAIKALQIEPEHLLIDAMTLEKINLPQTSIIKGDAKSASIAAASVLAKVTRDKLMADYANTYPHYDFEHNAGYGTAKHLEGINLHGITPIHRKSYEPIKSMIDTK